MRRLSGVEILPGRSAPELAEESRREHASSIENLQERVAALERVTKWELVRRVTLSQPSSRIGFGSLDGDRDGEYRLIGKMIEPTTVFALYELEINGDASTEKSSVFLRYGGGGAQVDAASVMSVARGVNQPAVVTFEGTLFARSGSIRLYQGLQMQSDAGANEFIGIVGGTWDNTADVVTSLSIHRASTEMDAGSWVELWRRRRAS